MSTKNQVSTKLVSHIANLANIPVSDSEEKAFAAAFEETLEVVDSLKVIDVSSTDPTHQVTGLENVWREDVVLDQYSFSQAQALANAPAQHDGYFMVHQIIEQTD